MFQSTGWQGSREGRCVAPEELAQGKEGRFTLRDYAFEEIEQVINIGPDMAAKFLSQLQKDVQLLCDNNVMDYSLLVGVHHRNGPARKCTPTEYQHTNTIFEVEKGGIPSACGKKVTFPIPALHVPVHRPAHRASRVADLLYRPC